MQVIIYFARYILYYCSYFKLDLSFYTFVIIFRIRRMVEVVGKNQWRQIFRYGGSISRNGKTNTSNLG
jgi:hypothetical protein